MADVRPDEIAMVRNAALMPLRLGSPKLTLDAPQVVLTCSSSPIQTGLGSIRSKRVSAVSSEPQPTQSHMIETIKAIIAGVALALLGVPFALIIGIITGVGSLIPIAGFLMGMIPGVLIAGDETCSQNSDYTGLCSPTAPLPFEKLVAFDAPAAPLRARRRPGPASDPRVLARKLTLPGTLLRPAYSKQALSASAWPLRSARYFT